jgi:tRNA A37 N6-isopentenylltransferase MiaA
LLNFCESTPKRTDRKAIELLMIELYVWIINVIFLFQIYKGLDVVTAKANKQEREAAVHHLLDILEPHQMFTVVDFRNRALKIVSLTKYI